MMIALVGLGFFLSGCGSLMVDANTPPTATAGTARIYFALDQGYPPGSGFITEGTRLLGFISNGKHFVADVPAGQHLLILKSESDEAIQGNFEAGKTYAIRLFVTPGVMSTRTYWTPLKNSGEDLKLRKEMIAETELTVLVPEKAAEWEADEKEELEERTKSFTSGEDKIEGTIGPEHGL